MATDPRDQRKPESPPLPAMGFDTEAEMRGFASHVCLNPSEDPAVQADNYEVLGILEQTFACESDPEWSRWLQEIDAHNFNQVATQWGPMEISNPIPHPKRPWRHRVFDRLWSWTYGRLVD